MKNKTIVIILTMILSILISGCSKKWDETHVGVHEVTVYTLLHGPVKTEALIKVFESEDGSQKAKVFYPDGSIGAMNVDLAKTYFDKKRK